MTTGRTPRHPSLVVLCGPPGVGKSTIAEALAGQVEVDRRGVRGRRAKRHARGRLLRTRATRLHALRAVALVLTSSRGRLTSRIRRARLVANGLVRYDAMDGRPVLLDDGPVDYLAAVRWRGPRAELAAQLAAARVLADRDGIAVSVTATRELVLSRLGSRERERPTVTLHHDPDHLRPADGRDAGYLIAREALTRVLGERHVVIDLGDAAPATGAPTVRALLEGDRQ